MRFGLRTVLSAASRPSSPKRLSTGRESHAPIKAIIGPATITPMNRASAPKPTATHGPSSTPTAPSTISTSAQISRLRLYGLVSTAAWRIASIGSARDARRAGIRTDR